MKWDINQEEKQAYIASMKASLPMFRAAMGLTQLELAQIIGVTRQTIVAIENSTSRLSWVNFLALMFVFSTDEKCKEILLVSKLHLLI